MTDLSSHYIRVRDYAREFSLDESTVYKMIDRGEIKAIRIGKKTLRIPSSELERYLYPEPKAETETSDLDVRAKAFSEETGRDPHSFVEAWRKGEIEDNAKNAEIAIEALALRSALDRQHVPV